MNAITKEEQTALTLPQRAAVALGESANETKLRELVAKSAGIVTVTNPDGREEAHRAGMVLLKTRTGIRATGKAARDDATKFSKAVIAMEDELIGIIEPEETRIFGLRDGFDEAEKARTAALIAAERARTEAIAKAIQAIRDLPLMAVGKSSADISAMIGGLVSREPDESFEEFIEQAKAARHEALDKLAAAETAQRGIEIEAESQRQEAARVAAEAEELRLAAAARIEAERQELAKLRADAERVANEQAAERQRLANLAAAQEAEARRIREQAAANLKAERDAQELAMRLAREKAAKEQAERDEAAAEQQRQLAAQQAEIDAKRAAFAREQEEAAARVEAAAKMEADHPQGLLDNAQFDVDREAERVRKQAMADQHLIDKRNLPPPESYCERDEQADAGISEDPSDEEIIEQIAESFRMTFSEALDRVSVIAFAELRAELVAA